MPRAGIGRSGEAASGPWKGTWGHDRPKGISVPSNGTSGDDRPQSDHHLRQETGFEHDALVRRLRWKSTSQW